MGSMFSKVSYDQIYDEHIYMFSASSVNKICKLFDMELINIVKQITNMDIKNGFGASFSSELVISDVQKLRRDHKTNDF